MNVSPVSVFTLFQYVRFVNTISTCTETFVLVSCCFFLDECVTEITGSEKGHLGEKYVSYS